MLTGLLYLTTALLFGLWTGAQSRAAVREFEDLAVRRSWVIAAALLFAGWTAFVYAVAASGMVARFDSFPPPFAAFMLAMFVMAGYAAFSRFGTMLIKYTPLWVLIAFQCFRVLAELVLYLALKEGLAPVQLTVDGYQFDIITGLSALPVALHLRRIHNTRLAWAWNVMGMLFLGVIAFIAITSMPTPLRVFMNEPSNIWVTSWPYILLPGIVVTAAITGHLLCFRKLWLDKTPNLR